MSKKSRIPTVEEFRRASQYMAERFRNLERVRGAVLSRFKDLSPLHTFDILPQSDVDFRAYVFFETNKDVDACQKNGISQQIEDCVYEELERAGRGQRTAIKVAFEYDSDENVIANYEGNYFLRLR
jgi:hypothetical protein